MRGLSNRADLLNDTLLAALKKVDPMPGGYFFPSSRRARYTNITKVFNNAVKRAGIRKVRFHDLRHTFQTLLFDDGANPLAVEKLVGHRLPPKLERYWHPSPTVLRDTVSRLDRILHVSYCEVTRAQKGSGQTTGQPLKFK